MIKRLLLVASLLVMIAGVGFYLFKPTTLGVGTALPDAPALFETSLATPITSSATSFSLTTNSVRGGGTLSGYQCFTIDEGSAQAEFVCGTASGTSITSVTRGISPSDGTSQVATLMFSHRRGASVKITDFPLVQILRNQNNGSATFENVLTYAAGVTPSGASELADVGYVLSVVNGGTVNFDALVVGGTAGETLSTGTLIYFKTTDQRWWKVNATDTTTFQDKAVGIARGDGAAAGTIGNGGVLLKGLQSGLSALTAGSIYYASSSGTFSTTTGVFPIGFARDTTSLIFDPVMISIPRLGGNNIFSGTNTFSGTSITGHASTAVRVYTSSSTWTKPAGLEYIIVEVQGAGGDGSNTGGGGGGAYAREYISSSTLSGTTSVSVVIGGAGIGSGTTSFSTFTVAGNGSNASGATLGNGGSVLSSGNLNIDGQSGQTGAGSSGGGAGGGSALGKGGFFTPPGTAASTRGGFDGSGYGGGGAGCADANDGLPTCVASEAGNGMPGVVIITEYY